MYQITEYQHTRLQFSERIRYFTGTNILDISRYYDLIEHKLVEIVNLFRFKKLRLDWNSVSAKHN